MAYFIGPKLLQVLYVVGHLSVPWDIRARLPDHLQADHPQVLNLLKSSYLFPPSLLPYNLTTDPRIIMMGKASPFILTKVSELFSGQRGGFFVEAGALDGQRSSNTLWLEKKMNWTGLLVEPNPHSFQKLVQKRRKAWASNTCLSPHPYPIQQVLVSVSKKLKYSQTRRAASFLRGYELDADIQRNTMKKSNTSYVRTQCFPLASYLFALNVTQVDFLSLDIQGVEEKVLTNFPWDRINIRVMVVELVHQDHYNWDFRSFMREKNYTLLGQHHPDFFFVKNGDSILERYIK